MNSKNVGVVVDSWIDEEDLPPDTTAVPIGELRGGRRALRGYLGGLGNQRTRTR